VAINVNTEKIKRMFMSRHQNVGQNNNVKMGNKSFENVAKFKCLQTANYNHEKIKSE